MTTLGNRFWDKVDKRDAASCWEWQGAVANNGYGRFGFQGKNAVAHRLVALHEMGMPPHLFALHKCDNRRCVNPAHIFFGTYSDNAFDRELKARRASAGSANGRAIIDESTAAEIKQLLKTVPRRPTGAVKRGELARIARRLAIPDYIVHGISRGKSWTHVESK